MTETNQKTKKISRRDAIKLLGAAAGATVLANLPSKWNTPEIARGVLPAHAQTSGLDLTIAGCTLVVNSGINPPDDDGWNSTVTVGAPSIIMNYSLFFHALSFSANFPGPNNAPGPNPVTGTATTNAGGVATITDASPGLDTLVTDISTPDGIYSLTVLWSFNNPSDGTGTCDTSVFWSPS